MSVLELLDLLLEEHPPNAIAKKLTPTTDSTFFILIIKISLQKYAIGLVSLALWTIKIYDRSYYICIFKLLVGVIFCITKPEAF